MILDQVSKAIARIYIKPYINNLLEMNKEPHIKILGDFFRLTYVENSGMAFGINFGSSGFFTVFAAIASLAILIYLYKVRGDKLNARIALALILGGAIGNLIDRVLFSKVVDFIDCDFFNIHLGAKKILLFDFPGYNISRWPVYNIADAAVTVGMIILVIFVLFEKGDAQTAEADVLNDEKQIVR
jgi:signal peptidase II